MGKKNKTEAVLAEPNREWEHESNTDAVIRAHDILNDPKKMKGVKKHLKKKKKAMRSVQDLINHRQNKFGGPGGGPKEEYDEKDETDSGLVG